MPPRRAFAVSSRQVGLAGGCKLKSDRRGQDQAPRSRTGKGQKIRGRPATLSLLYTHLLLLPTTWATMVILVSSDNEQFVVDGGITERIGLIGNSLEGKSTTSTPATSCLITRSFTEVGESNQLIPLPKVSSHVLKKVWNFDITKAEDMWIHHVLSRRFWSTANITGASRSPPPMKPTQMSTESERLILANGTRNSSPLIRRCSSRSS